MSQTMTPNELECHLGEHIKTLRLQRNLSRQALCLQTGISENALRHLEGGSGSTVRTLVAVLKALNRESWIASLAPETSINPLHMVRNKPQRQRASKQHDKKS